MIFDALSAFTLYEYDTDGQQKNRLCLSSAVYLNIYDTVKQASVVVVVSTGWERMKSDLDPPPQLFFAVTFPRDFFWKKRKAVLLVPGWSKASAGCRSCDSNFRLFLTVCF